MKNIKRSIEYGYTIVDFDDLDDVFTQSEGRATARVRPYGVNNPRPATTRYAAIGADRCRVS